MNNDQENIQPNSDAQIETKITEQSGIGELDDVDKEQQELELVKKNFNDAPRFTRWRELYLDINNTYGLKTFKDKQLSALYAYGLNPEDQRDRQYASELGYKNARKCQNWARDYYEASGITQEKVLDIIADKAISTNNSRALQMLAELAGVYTPQPQTIVQQNNQTNNYIEPTDEEKKDFNEAFKKFLMQR